MAPRGIDRRLAGSRLSHPRRRCSLRGQVRHDLPRRRGGERNPSQVLSLPDHSFSVAEAVELVHFDGIDNSAYVTGKARHSARDGWIYTDGEKFCGMRYDAGRAPENPDSRIAWKLLYTSKDTWLGPERNLGAIGSTYNLTMDPYEKYDMTFNGAVAVRNPTTSPGRYSGMDNGWAITLLDIPLMEFNKSIVQYPNKKRAPGGASNDMIPNLQSPENPLPYDPIKLPKTIGAH